MENISSNISDARKLVTVLAVMTRWIWVVNSLVLIAGVAYERYDVTALAAFTWVFSLLAAALGHRAAAYLIAVERSNQSVAPILTPSSVAYYTNPAKKYFPFVELDICGGGATETLPGEAAADSP